MVSKQQKVDPLPSGQQELRGERLPPGDNARKELALDLRSIFGGPNLTEQGKTYLTQSEKEGFKSLQSCFAPFFPSEFTFHNERGQNKLIPAPNSIKELIKKVYPEHFSEGVTLASFMQWQRKNGLPESGVLGDQGAKVILNKMKALGLLE